MLLFSKAVILVEGDGEELLIPSLVKQCFGVSLDELGIGLINVGSVTFEYIACIFSDDRIQRRCAIVTDLDAVVKNAEKCSEKAAQLGASRKKKIDNLFEDDIWVSAFFAPHTLEIDFYNLEDNRKYIKKIINQHYKQKATKENHIANLSANEADRYDTVLTVVSELKKGWHGILLANDIDRTVRIPEYIVQALAFATQDVITPHILKRMALYVLESYKDESNLKNNMFNARTEEEILESIDAICAEYEEDEFTLFAELWKEYKGYE